MKKENAFVLIVGIILGALVVLYVQAQISIVNQKGKIADLEETVNSNEQAVTQIVQFLNGGTQGQGQPQGQPQAQPEPTN